MGEYTGMARGDGRGDTGGSKVGGGGKGGGAEDCSGKGGGRDCGGCEGGGEGTRVHIATWGALNTAVCAWMNALIRDVFVGEDRVYFRANAPEFDRKICGPKFFTRCARP